MQILLRKIKTTHRRPAKAGRHKTQKIMNHRNKYKSLLKQANEELSKYGVKLVLQEDDGYYNLDVYGFAKNNGVEHYAENYIEDELDGLITDAWHDMLKRAERREKYRKMREERESRPLEMINRVELLGVVGSARLSTINDTKIVKFSLVTNRCYKNREGCPVMETQWHNCVAIESDKVTDLDKIQKGATVHLFGRLKSQRYATNTGEEKISLEIHATKLEVVNLQEPAQCETD